MYRQQYILSETYNIGDTQYRPWPINKDYMVSRDGDIINMRYNSCHISPRKRQGRKPSVRLSVRGSQRYYKVETVVNDTWPQEEEPICEKQQQKTPLFDLVQTAMRDVLGDRSFAVVFDTKGTDDIPGILVVTSNGMDRYQLLSLLEKEVAVIKQTITPKDGK